MLFILIFKILACVSVSNGTVEEYVTHTADHIEESVKNMVEAFGLDFTKIEWTTDGAANMKKAFRQNGFSCADHAFDLMLKAGWKLAEEACPELMKLRKAVKKLGKKSLRTAAIRSNLAANGKSIQRLVITRWATHYYLFSSVLGAMFLLKGFFSGKYSDYKQLYDEVEEQQSLLYQVVEFLEPFKQMIDLLSSELRPTMHLVTIFAEKTVRICDKVIEEKEGPIVHLATQMKRAMTLKLMPCVKNPRKEKKKSEKKRKRQEYLVARRLCASNIEIDEKFWGADLTVNDIDKKIRNEIKKEVTKEKQRKIMNSQMNLLVEKISPVEDREKKTEGDANQMTPTVLPKFKSVIDDLIADEDMEEKEETPAEIATRELEVYKSNLKVIVGKNKNMKRAFLVNPLRYHDVYESLHPRLSKVAVRYLSRPGTSAKAERNFADMTVSTFGRRNRTSLMNVHLRQQLRSALIYKERQAAYQI